MAPIVLAVIGGVLFLAAIALYSSPGELHISSYATIQFRSKFKIGAITYTVRQVSPSIAEIDVEIAMPNGIRYPPAKGLAASLTLFVPPKITFRTCPIGSCHFYSATNQYYWFEPLKFTQGFSGIVGMPTGLAVVHLFVKANGFGYAFNGINALASIPEVEYYAAGTPTLETEYADAPAASSYDWSSFPTAFANGTTAVWDEPVSGGAAPGRVAVGIDEANQAKDNNKTFFAGALVGLAGGALLSAVQEALHAND